MSRLAAIGLLSSLACSGCIASLFEDRPPPVPDGYPQLEALEDGRAELVIDGENYVTEDDGGTSFNAVGGFEDQLRARTSFDYTFHLDYRDIEVGEYTSAAGDLEANRGLLKTGDACGNSSIKIIGRDSWDSGPLGEQQFIWGVISVRLCGTDYDPDAGGEVAVEEEITGRFASVVSER